MQAGQGSLRKNSLTSRVLPYAWIFLSHPSCIVCQKTLFLQPQNNHGTDHPLCPATDGLLPQIPTEGCGDERLPTVGAILQARGQRPGCAYAGRSISAMERSNNLKKF